MTMPKERKFTLDEVLELSESMEADFLYSRTWVGVSFCQIYSPVLHVTTGGEVTFHLGDGCGSYMKLGHDKSYKPVFTTFLKIKNELPDEELYFAAIVGSLMRPDGKIDLNSFAEYFSLDVKKGDYENIFYQ